MQFPNAQAYIRELMFLSVNGGICTGDFDEDGMTDFYVTSPRGGNRLYRNVGEFRFETTSRKRPTCWTQNSGEQARLSWMSTTMATWISTPADI